jgi:hypothetical protein
LNVSFIESLSAKVHPTPPTIDKLSTLFQEFYSLSATHINTHISAISSKQHRESSPSPASSRSSAASKIRAKAASIGNKDHPRIPPERKDSEQQMLTAEEIADRKRARKVLEQKRIALEEAVEKRVCEGVYDRIWRHRSTQDEAQDDKLRSKTAALAVVGIGLTDLGIDISYENSDDDKELEVRRWLDGAREELLGMNDMKYPLGKLQHLKAAHKAIVDTLSHFHPSSSADEIMPMLIYTLITSPIEGTNVISNLYFIQRFRSESKIDGEAAYCLTNLEAAITFLETVDLASLRADEALSGPPKSNSRPSTPIIEKSNSIPFPKLSTPTLSPTAISSVSSETSAPIKSEPSPNSLRPAIQAHNRRFSDLFQPPAQALGAAGDAVLNTADQGFKTIGNSLGESYKFLVGKLKERQDGSPDGQESGIIVPKTLDDARKLVGTPPPQEEEGSVSGASSMHNPEDTADTRGAEAPSKPDDKILSLIGGRRPARDHSADSVRSSGSGKKVAFAEDMKEKSASPLSAAALTAASPLESMRNLGNTFNPMSRIAGMGMMRGFGRSAAPAPAAIPKSVPDGGIADLTTVGISYPFLIMQLLISLGIPRSSIISTTKRTYKSGPSHQTLHGSVKPGGLKNQ